MSDETVMPTGIYEAPIRLFGVESWEHESHIQEQENAIAYYNAAFPLFTRAYDPRRWASLQISLAKLYQGRLTGTRHGNLEQAMQCCHHALQIYTYDDLPMEWAHAHATLGSVYTSLGCSASACGYRLEQALEHYQYAQQILTEETFPAYWAIIQQGVSAAYIWRVDGKKSENLQKSIVHGQAALRLLTQATYPFEWAATHANLGEAYRQASLHDDLQELYSGYPVILEQAIRHLEAALQVYTRHTYPLEWAETQRFLSLVYLDRVRHRQSENFAQAPACSEAYLQISNYNNGPSQICEK